MLSFDITAPLSVSEAQIHISKTITCQIQLVYIVVRRPQDFKRTKKEKNRRKFSRMKYFNQTFCRRSTFRFFHQRFKTLHVLLGCSIAKLSVATVSNVQMGFHQVMIIFSLILNQKLL